MFGSANIQDRNLRTHPRIFPRLAVNIGWHCSLATFHHIKYRSMLITEAAKLCSYQSKNNYDKDQSEDDSKKVAPKHESYDIAGHD